MRWTSTLAALAIFTLAGCQNPIHLGGEYRSRSGDDVKQTEMGTLIENDRWTFLWGLIDTGKIDVHDALDRKLRPNECFTDLEVRQNTTLPGVILGWATLGIVSHEEVVVRGRRGVVRRERAWDAETKPSESSSPQ